MILNIPIHSILNKKVLDKQSRICFCVVRKFHLSTETLESVWTELFSELGRRLVHKVRIRNTLDSRTQLQKKWNYLKWPTRSVCQFRGNIPLISCSQSSLMRAMIRCRRACRSMGRVPILHPWKFVTTISQTPPELILIGPYWQEWNNNKSKSDTFMTRPTKFEKE